MEALFMFEWKDKYSVGVEKFDNQHKKLLEIGRNKLSRFGKTQKNS